MNLADVMDFAQGFHGRVMDAFGHAAQDGVTRIVGERASKVRIELTVADGSESDVVVRWRDWGGAGRSLPEALANLRGAWEGRRRVSEEVGDEVRILRLARGGYRVYLVSDPTQCFGRYGDFDSAARACSLNGYVVVGEPEDGVTEIVEFAGIQDWGHGRWAELWHLAADVELSKPNGVQRLIRGSTVARADLAAAGILVPDLFPGA